MVGARSTAELQAVSTAIALPAVIVQSKGHGHAGTAMALAPLAHVLFQRVLKHNPLDPAWEGRDRLILSAGHASLLLYTQLYLCGYGLTLEDLAASRALRSRTPGHPELGVTPGVEMSTGPLGQGLASAVGLALSLRRDTALHDAGAGVWDATVYALAGDGCLQEGVSAEASSLAGTLGIDNLVAIWDDNGISIDGPTSTTFAEDVRDRYRAYGWRIIEVQDARNLDEIENALLTARERTGRPTLVAVRSVIGSPADEVAGTSAAHAGPLGEKTIAGLLTTLGLTSKCGLNELVSDAVLAFTREAIVRGESLQKNWTADRERWADEHSDLNEKRCLLKHTFGPHTTSAFDDDSTLGDSDRLSRFLAGEPLATRVANGTVVKALHERGVIWGGSADLAGSTNIAVPGEPVSAHNPAGEFIPFGIREHAMAAILSGIALHGLWRPFGSTYLAFSDYQRPSLRLAALMSLPTIYVYTHDSVAVGEDGPTHQPVEQIASLRTVPNLSVIRPADASEVFAAWRTILAKPSAPTALVLSRQALPALPDPAAAASGVSRGGYVAWKSGEEQDIALIATGSEVALAIDAARRLQTSGINARVVSMPCVEWFESASPEWREEVLPQALAARVAIEAGRGDAWYRWVGGRGRVISIDDFGESGPGAAVLELRGLTVDAVVDAAMASLADIR
ncbi:transketolase [Paramicrobacterium humi]|uniref:transketolase n=1 Tax=Paramicrobacterium humi TaxID=640635 RepID=A0A1H4L9E2_9MICO|nr:transketolase [Microbacterium humi]